MANQRLSDRELRDARFAALADAPLVRTGAKGGALGGSWASLREILGQREMLGLLVRRDLKARYKDSTLGFLWSLVRPLTQLVIYYVVIGRFLGAARGTPDFAIYVFTGLTAYTLFSEIVAGGTSSIVGNSGLIKKIYLPREIFPLASVGSALFNFLIQFGILVIATLVLRKFPIHPGIVYLIPAFLLVLVFGTAFAILLSAANVYLRDIQYLVEVGLMILMWEHRPGCARQRRPAGHLHEQPDHPGRPRLPEGHVGERGHPAVARMAPAADADRDRHRSDHAGRLPAGVRAPAGQLRAGTVIRRP